MNMRKIFTVKVIKYWNRLPRDAAASASSGTSRLHWTRPSANSPCFKLGERGRVDKMTSRGHIQAIILITVFLPLWGREIVLRLNICFVTLTTSVSALSFSPFSSQWGSNYCIDCKTKIHFFVPEPSIFCGQQMAITCTNVWILWKWICCPFLYSQTPASEEMKRMDCNCANWVTDLVRFHTIVQSALKTELWGV